MDESFSLVVVEGTFKALKRYSKLMLRRIDWEEGKDLDDEEGEKNVCVLVWQGEVVPKARVVEAKVEPVPEVEWWDAPLLENKHYDSVRGGNWKINATKMNIYVEHPVKLEPPIEAAAPPPQPLKLTKKEHKKLRTQRRLQREKERQEMIKQGLLEPPKPKVKISNLMRVMGMEATADPTQIEKEVREQMAERSTAHEDRNLARKLTASERRDKKSRKLFEDDLHPETMAAVYKVKNLTNKHNQWKVDINAQENKLT
eukprot:gene19443-23249_t